MIGGSCLSLISVKTCDNTAAEIEVDPYGELAVAVAVAAALVAGLDPVLNPLGTATVKTSQETNKKRACLSAASVRVSRLL